MFRFLHVYYPSGYCKIFAIYVQYQSINICYHNYFEKYLIISMFQMLSSCRNLLSSLVFGICVLIY